MKKSSLFTIAGILTLVRIIFNIVCYILGSFGIESGVYKYLGPTAAQVIPWIVITISLVVLAVGFLLKNKFLIFGFYILDALASIIYIIENIVSIIRRVAGGMGPSITSIISNIGYIVFDAAMILFVIAVFSKDELDNTSDNSIVYNTMPTNNNNNINTESIIQYKELLDSGAITQEEFDKKKKELLGL